MKKEKVRIKFASKLARSTRESLQDWLATEENTASI